MAQTDKLSVLIDVVTDQAEKSLSKFQSALGGVGNVAGKVGKGVGIAAGVMATGIAAAATATVNAAKETAAYGDNIDKMSQKMGMSAEGYQEWDFIMQHCGTSMETMKASMKTLANAAENNSDAFGRLGITQEEIANLDQEGLFNATIEALSNVEDETERTYLAGQLLGKGATELGPLLNTSAEEIAGMKQQAHDLGIVMSDEAVKASATFQDSLQNLTQTTDGIKNALMAELLPSMSTAMDGITEILAGNTEEGAQILNDGITTMLESLGEMAPQALTIVETILETLLQVLIENLPQIFEMGMELLFNLVNGILENLPALIEAALQIILAVCTGIAQYLPELVPTIVNIVVQIVNTLLNNLDLLIDCAVQLILAIALGLTNAIPELISAVPQIISAIIKAFVDNKDKFADAGKQLLTGLADGIGKSVGNVVKKAKEAAQKVLSSVKGFFGIHSPSTVFKGVGAYLMEGLGIGIEDNEDFAINAMRGLTESVESSFNPNLNMSYSGDGGVGSSSINGYSWIDELVRKLDGDGNGRPIILQVDGKTWAQTSISTINNLTKQTGKLDLIVT